MRTRKRDSKATRQHILEQAAALLNTSGYLSTSVSDIMRVTGLGKGGIYHHFESLEDLALESFQFAVGRVKERVLRIAHSNVSARDKLLALIAVFKNLPLDEVLRGGCPIVNLAIESDHAHPRLRAAAAEAMSLILSRFEEIIDEGMRSGEFSKGDARARAVQIVAALEGAVMLSNIYKDYAYLQGVADHLSATLPQAPR